MTRIFPRIFFGLCLAVLPCSAFAATVYLDPQSGVYHPGDTFVVNIRLDTNGECVNVVSGEIVYPSGFLQASAVSQGESILTLWTEEPKIDTLEGRVRFSGGVPGGYCGRIAGDPGYANILLKVIFTVPNGTPSGSLPPITVSPLTQVFLADGRGTLASLLTGTAEFSVATSSGKIVNEWLDEIDGDATPPEPFAIDLHHDSAVMGGRYFIVFQTTDKQSGVDHYEVMERDHDRPQFMRGTRTSPVWKKIVSPYVLTDQTLMSSIIVRAVDNAGQIREEVLDPSPQAGARTPNTNVLLVLGGVFVCVVVLSFFLRRRHAHLSRS